MLGFGAGPVLVPCMPAKAKRMSLFHVKLDPPKPNILEIRRGWSQLNKRWMSVPMSV